MRSSTVRAGVETPNAELRRLVEPVVRSEGWVIDGAYLRKLGTLVLDAADTVVRLDLPMRVWMWRTAAPPERPRAAVERQPRVAANGGVGRDSLFGYALRHHRLARRTWPAQLVRYPVVRLTSPAAVEHWLSSVTAPDALRTASTIPRQGSPRAGRLRSS
jgi:hypothetical protein